MDSKHVVLLLDESGLKSNDKFNLRISLHRRWNKFSRLQKQTILFLFLSTFVIILFLSSLTNPPKTDSFNKFKDTKLAEDYGASDKIFFDDYLTVVHNLEKNAKKNKFTSKQKEVIDAFKFAWSNYKKYAWGHDILKPNSMLFRDDYHLGLSIVDGIDTLFMMDLKEDYISARDWIKNHLNFDYNKPVSVFEVTIRVLGGLLAIYHMTEDKVFLEKAQQLGDKLSFAFHTKSKVPYSDVNFHSNISQSPFWVKYSSTAEIGTLQLEFRDLSRSSNIPKYEELAANVSSHIHGLNKTDGLVPIFISPSTGNFHPSTITMGARADSYYEYLLKQWLQTGKTNDDLKNDYIEAIDGAEKNLMKRTYKSNLLFIGELFSNNEFSPKMDHLACFLPGTLILGARNGLPKHHETLAQELIQTCYKMYEINANFLSGEIAYFHTSEPSLPQDDIYFKKNDNYNLLRPEFVESLYYMYYFTGNRTYQDWGYKIFHAFMNYTKVENGFKGIRNDVNHDASNLHDEMDSYFLSETLKYFFLLFDDETRDQIDLKKFVFNTEGHPLPIYAH